MGSTVYTVVEIWKLRALLSEAPDSLTSLEWIEKTDFSYGGLTSLLSMVTGLAMLFFVARLAQGTRSLGADNLKFSPSKAVWGYIIPILNVSWPYQAMREAWKVSDPRATPDNWQGMDNYGLVKLWWGLTLLGIGVGFYWGYQAGTAFDAGFAPVLTLQLRTNLFSLLTTSALLGMVKVMDQRMQAKWQTQFGPQGVATAKIARS